MAVTPVLFLVPARGGSARIPGKNLRTVAGIPLVAQAVRTARRAAGRLTGGPHPVVCSTDDPAIADVAAAWGASVLDRPAELATAAASSVDVALHALDALDPDCARFGALALVQPTSPLTDPGDLCAAVRRFDEGGARSLASVTASHPVAFHVARDTHGRVTPLDEAAPDVLSGAFYVVDPTALRRDRRFVVPGETLAFPVPPERSVDIDEPADLLVAEAFADARPVDPLQIGARTVGAGPAFLIAEGGVNHDGDVDRAHRIVDAAADAGADCVKFQTFDPEALVAAGAPLAEYQQAGERSTDQRAMLARLALPHDAWAGLRDHATDRGLVFLSTPFDDASADLLDALAVPAFKVGSGELTNLPFLERLARRGRPLLVSTGMADMVEVAAAVDAVTAAGDGGLGLLHCVSAYPAAPGDANLRAIATMRRAFGVPTGWSDHTPGIELPVAAVALGASIVEKHLTLDRSLPGPDHRASLEPDAFRAMVAAIRATESALGSGDKVPTPAEAAIAAVARRSLHWRRSLDPGAVVAADDLAALRPGTGLPPAQVVDLVGRRIARRVEAGAIVAVGDVEVLA